jgi:hypothetical protein
MAIQQSLTVEGVTITINAEDVAVITAETAISILLALSPLGVVALPAWALVVLPLIRAELPLAEQLANEVAVAIEANQTVEEVVAYLKNALTFWKAQGYANANTDWTE